MAESWGRSEQALSMVSGGRTLRAYQRETHAANCELEHYSWSPTSIIAFMARERDVEDERGARRRSCVFPKLMSVLHESPPGEEAATAIDHLPEKRLHLQISQC